MDYIDVNGDKYIVNYRRQFQYMTEEESIKCKESLGCEFIIKNTDSYFFCDKMTEAVIIEDISTQKLIVDSEQKN